MLRSGLIAKECRSAPLPFKTDQNHPNTRCALYQIIIIHTWLHSTSKSTDRNGADAGPAPFLFSNGAGPTRAPFLRFGVDSYFKDSIMTIEDQNGDDHVDRNAQWPHFLNKETRFCFVAQRVATMRWGRRCWDCPYGPSPVVRPLPGRPFPNPFPHLLVPRARPKRNPPAAGVPTTPGQGWSSESEHDSSLMKAAVVAMC